MIDETKRAHPQASGPGERGCRESRDAVSTAGREKTYGKEWQVICEKIHQAFRARYFPGDDRGSKDGEGAK